MKEKSTLIIRDAVDPQSVVEAVHEQVRASDGDLVLIEACGNTRDGVPDALFSRASVEKMRRDYGVCDSVQVSVRPSQQREVFEFGVGGDVDLETQPDLVGLIMERAVDECGRGEAEAVGGGAVALGEKRVGKSAFDFLDGAVKRYFEER